MFIRNETYFHKVTGLKRLNPDTVRIQVSSYIDTEETERNKLLFFVVEDGGSIEDMESADEYLNEIGYYSGRVEDNE